MNLKLIDLHCDTMGMSYMKNTAFKDLDGHINTEKLVKGGCMAQALALFIPSDGHTGPDGKPTWDVYKELLAVWKREVAANSDVLRPAYSAEEVRKNTADGYITALLTVEDCIGVDGKIERIEEMYEDGVRMATLTWNWENSIGYPNSADPELHKKGLKDFGFEAVKKMNELGMIVDVSHLSEGGFWDVIKTTTKPIAASHSCARDVWNHQRNLTDKQLKALADNGGIVGMNFLAGFLGQDEQLTHISDIVEHMKHVRDVAGIDVMGWGSDFDGFGCDLEFKDYAGFPMILEEMEKVFTDDEMDKINHENFLRVFAAQK